MGCGGGGFGCVRCFFVHPSILNSPAAAPETRAGGVDSLHMYASAISLHDVRVVRAGTCIASCARLTVQPGQHWAVLGPNGAGKTTLLKVMGTLLFPSEGQVEVFGIRLGQVNVFELRRHIGYVDPKQALADMPCFEAVLSGVTASNGYLSRWQPTGEQVALTQQLLELVGMDGKKDALWSQMSQGEKARTLLARALVTRPKLLLLDEPSTGLDLPGRERLLAVIDDMRANIPELASVVITHHVEEIAASTTHALLLKQAAVMEQGPVGEVLTSSNLSRLFDLPIQLQQHAGRYLAAASSTDFIHPFKSAV